MSGGNDGKPHHVYLIDGSGFIFRAYYGIKADMSRADGTPTNAVFGFTQMLLKMADDTDADYIAGVFDRARKTFRSDIYPEYKAHRPPPRPVPRRPSHRRPASGTSQWSG